MSCTEWVQTHTTIIQTVIQMVVKWLEVHLMENVTSVARKDTEPTNVLRKDLEETKTEMVTEAVTTPEVEVTIEETPSSSTMELVTIVVNGAT